MADRIRMRCGEDAGGIWCLISFPGDERASGRVSSAAGRGFFHINASGAGRSRVRSPPIRTPVCRTYSLKEAHAVSTLFRRLRERRKPRPVFHTGGCALFEQEETGEKIYLDRDAAE